MLNDPASPFHGQMVDDLNGALGARKISARCERERPNRRHDSRTHPLWALHGDHGNLVPVTDASDDVNVLIPGSYSTDEEDSFSSYADVVWRDEGEIGTETSCCRTLAETLS